MEYISKKVAAYGQFVLVDTSIYFKSCHIKQIHKVINCSVNYFMRRSHEKPC